MTRNTGQAGAWGMVAAAGVLAIVLWAIYGQALDAPFVFDDRTSVLENDSITKLWPLVGSNGAPGPLNPSPGMPTSGRPLVNLTLAINYHFGEFRPWGYHAFNLAVHFVSTLLVLLITRQILELDFFGGRFTGVSGVLAFLTALLWAVHPLQIETVVYVTQRTELMVGLFYLVTVYASLRYWSAETERERGSWLAIATAACAAGMACKEVMVTAPVVVLLMERTLVSGSFRRALAKSWRLYVGLSAGWVVLAVLNYGAPRSASAGFHLNVAATTWWLTQAKVLWMYLKLVVWPWPLLIHYDVPYLETIEQAWPWVAATGVLAIGTMYLLWRRWAAGLAGAWVLLILSPTLIVPIITEVAAERRMYLPLAGIAVLAVAGSFSLVRQIAGQTRKKEREKTNLWGGASVLVAVTGTALAVVYSFVDVNRLAAFESPIALWQDTIRQGAADSFAYNNLGFELLNANRQKEAVEPLQKALALNQTDPKIYTNLGVVLDGLGKPSEAIEQFQAALKLDPNYVVAKRDLALSLGKIGRSGEALAELDGVVKSHPNSAAAHYDLAIALGEAGRLQEAVEEFQRAIAIRPRYEAAYNNLGVALVKLKQMDRAADAFEAALVLNPNNAETHKNLGIVLLSAGKSREAIEHFKKAAAAARSQGNAALAEAIENQLKSLHAE